MAELKSSRGFVESISLLKTPLKLQWSKLAGEILKVASAIEKWTLTRGKLKYFMAPDKEAFTDVKGVMIIRKEGATAIGGTGIEGSWPGVVDLASEAVNITQFVGDLQTIVVRIAVVVQLEDMIVLRKARTVRLSRGVAS